MNLKIDNIRKQWQLLMVFIGNKASLKMAVGVILGVAFSISVTLATIGIMDGFVKSLMSGLRKSTGELVLHSEAGFFYFDSELKSVFDSFNISKQTSIVITEGFLISGESSKGVLIRGVDETFSTITEMDVSLNEGEVAIGFELANILSLVKGDSIVLAFANGNEQFATLPLLIRFKINKIVNHGIYEKDLRFVYIEKKSLQKALKLDEKVNVVLLNLPESGNVGSTLFNDTEKITEFRKKIMQALPFDIVVRPYWSDFSYIIDAVKTEKFIIGMILQLIVIIAMFNVLAFLIYLREDNLKELFLLRALGLSSRGVVRIWGILVAIIWPLASGISLLFVAFFDYCLLNWDILRLPGDVYTLGSSLKISLELSDYLFVFGMTLVWLVLVVVVINWRSRKHPISGSLRKEFA